MSSQTNVVALKRLCAKIIGGDTTPADIPGGTIAEVIEQITTAYTSDNAQTLGALTVTSVAGSAKGMTKITVAGASASAILRYKLFSGSATLPARDENVSTWTLWDGISEIEAEDGQTIAVCEVDESDRALKAGKASVAIKMS